MRLPTALLVAGSRSAKVASMNAASTVALNDGTRHPIIGTATMCSYRSQWPSSYASCCTGYGTYKVGVIPSSASSAAAGKVAEMEITDPTECVRQAIECGYRFIDCAEFYANENAVGKAISSAGVPREQLYLASKVWTATIYKGPAAVQAQLEKTLADLRTG